MGDLLFVNIDKQPSSRGATGPQAPLTVANLQQVNTFILRHTENDADHWCAARKWRFFGVFNNEGVRHGSDRLINAVVRGRTVRTQNVWPNSRVGDKVGFVLGKVSSTDFDYTEDEVRLNQGYNYFGPQAAVGGLEEWMPKKFKLQYINCFFLFFNVIIFFINNK